MRATAAVATARSGVLAHEREDAAVVVRVGVDVEQVALPAAAAIAAMRSASRPSLTLTTHSSIGREPGTIRGQGSSWRRGSSDAAGTVAGVNLGAPELLIVLVVILVLFGGAKLPKLARSLGAAQNEFKQGLKDGKADEDDDSPSA